MKIDWKSILVLVLLLFGGLTLFLSSSVLLDLFGMRAKEGNYVLVVVWANFVASVLYLVSAFAIFKGKMWMVKPLVLALVVLVAGQIGFWIHIINDGLYENKTVGAMIFRILFTAVLLFTAYQVKPQENKLQIESDEQ